MAAAPTVRAKGKHGKAGRAAGRQAGLTSIEIQAKEKT